MYVISSIGKQTLYAHNHLRWQYVKRIENMQ